MTLVGSSPVIAGASRGPRRVVVARLAAVRLPAVRLAAVLGAMAAPAAAQRPASGSPQPQAVAPAAVGDTASWARDVRQWPRLGEDEIVRRALTVDPDVADAEGAVDVAGGDVRAARGAYLPALSLASSFTRANAPLPGAGAPGPAVPGVTPAGPGQFADNYGAGVAASFDVYTGGAQRAELARARAQRGAADESRSSRRYGAALAARRSYFDALRAGALVQVAVARTTQAEQALRYATARARAGTATRSDALRAELERTSALQQLLAARDTLASAAYALGRRVGVNGPVAAADDTAAGARDLSLGDTAIVALAADAAPLVRAARRQAEAAAAATRAARAQYAPAIRLTTGYNWANNVFTPAGIRPGWLFQLGAAYPLFDGYRRGAEVTRARAGANTADAAAADAARLARAEAARLVGALRTAVQSVALAEQGTRTAGEDLRVQARRYREGLATILDVLTSQTAVVQADLGLVAARYQAQIARATLEALLGRPL